VVVRVVVTVVGTAVVVVVGVVLTVVVGSVDEVGHPVFHSQMRTLRANIDETVLPVVITE